MEKTYRITIFSTSHVIERDFYEIETAISVIEEYKEKFYDYMIGILSKKVNGEWEPVYSISNNF